MKKILMVSCEGLGNGGVQAVMMNTVRGLSKQYQFDILLFTTQKRYYDDEFLSYGGDILRVPFYEGNNRIRRSADYYIRGIRLYYEVLHQVRNSGPYVAIHCNNEFESAICLKIGKKLGIPVRIFHAHTIADYGNPIRTFINNLYKKAIIKNATRLIGCSNESCESFFENEVVTEIVKNPYDNHKYFFSPIKNEEKRGLVLIQVGAFSTNKNQLYTLHVFRLILSMMTDAHLHFVGFDMDGTLNQLKEFVSLNKMNNSVTFWNSDVDIPTIMEKSDAFIMPSLHEGFGIVAIEAQAFGLKCYVSTSVPQTVNVGGCEFFDLNEDVYTVAKRLVNDYYAGKMKREKFDTNQYSLDTYLMKILSIYEGKMC